MKKLNKILIFVISVVLLSGCSVTTFADIPKTISVEDASSNTYKSPISTESPFVTSNVKNLDIHFIDVGQADCILLKEDENVLLIDSGGRKTADKVVKYLKDLGIDKIDLFIMTHPHEDHIGGAPKIIDNFKVDNIYMTTRKADSKIYKTTIETINKWNVKVVNPSVGDEFILGGLKGIVLGPKNVNDKNLNNTSIVVKISHGKNDFLFMGDAEKEEEEYIKVDVHADLIKVGHHGSKTSSSKDFMKKVSPTYAVIQAGKENSYGHPHKESLDVYQSLGIQVFRTDTMGTIVFTSDGKNIKHNAK